MDRYSARIAPSARIAEGVAYEGLLEGITEYTLRAAFAHAVDEHVWEHEELRRKGLSVIELFHDGRAVWQDRIAYEQALAEGDGTGVSFAGANELDAGLLGRIDRDLRRRWRRAGYSVSSLVHDMRTLFAELEADFIDRSREAREALVLELLRAGAPGAEAT